MRALGTIWQHAIGPTAGLEIRAIRIACERYMVMLKIEGDCESQRPYRQIRKHSPWSHVIALHKIGRSMLVC